MDKKIITETFEEIGLILELLGENPFKVRAYINGARIIELLDGDIDDYIKDNKLKDIKGIGKALSEKIEELVSTGKLQYYENLKNTVPEGLFEILKIPGIGPKKVKILYDKLNIKSIEELEEACLNNKILGMEGFGEKTQENILKEIRSFKKSSGLYLFGNVFKEASNIKNSLLSFPGTIRCEIAGSLRRKKEVVKDIDIVASSLNPIDLMDYFVSLPYVDEIITKGETKTSVKLKSGINMDLRVVSDSEYPYALHHFTGSKEHNTALRHRAKAMGIKVNEYGLFIDEKLLVCKEEQDIFNKLGLQYIAPEMRENNGEIEAAERKRLPNLIEISDVKGLFHIHTIYSDGNNSIIDYVNAARKMGLNYIGISDHSQAAHYAGGLNENALRKQFDEIDNLNKTLINFKIFKGIECDIMPDGSLDYSEEILKQFDFVIASVHSSFKMGKVKLTERIINAIKNNYVTMLGHPTGRLLLARDEYEVDIYAIIDAAAKYNKIIELNSDPHRLDLDWRYLKYAKEKGVKISINPDAHSVEGLYNYKIGIGIARKGWMEKCDILNAFNIDEVCLYMKGDE